MSSKTPYKHFLFQRIHLETPSMTSQESLPMNTLGLVGKREEVNTISIFFDKKDVSCEKHLKVQLNGHLKFRQGEKLVLNQQFQPLYQMNVDRSRQSKTLKEGALQMVYS